MPEEIQSVLWLLALVWAFVGLLYIATWLLESVSRVAAFRLKERALFERAFKDVTTRPVTVRMTKRVTPEAHPDVRWAQIRVGSKLCDVVSPECVDDLEALEYSLYMEGFDIMSHGG